MFCPKSKELKSKLVLCAVNRVNLGLEAEAETGAEDYITYEGRTQLEDDGRSEQNRTRY